MTTQKNIIITGACKGIGRAVADMLAEDGNTIGLHARKEDESFVQLMHELTGRGCRIVPLIGDLADDEFVESMVKTFIQAAGELNVLINNAAEFEYCHFSDLDAEQFHRSYHVNAFTPFILTRSAFQAMKTSGGRIINISSISTKYGGSEMSVHYAASKAALESLTKSFSRFGAEYNILVNAIRPGLIDTEFHSKNLKTDMDKRVGLIPLKRMGLPREIAGLVKYLTGTNGSFTTGQMIDVAGGD